MIRYAGRGKRLAPRRVFSVTVGAPQIAARQIFLSQTSALMPPNNRPRAWRPAFFFGPAIRAAAPIRRVNVGSVAERRRELTRA
jgi:hypothetical protein